MVDKPHLMRLKMELNRKVVEQFVPTMNQQSHLNVVK